MNSPVLLRNYITKYISFKGIEKEASRLEVKYLNTKLPVLLNREVTILINLLTPTQLNGLIRNTFIMMRRMNALMEDVKIPFFMSSSQEHKEANIDFVMDVCKTCPLVKEYLVIALYTYF